MDPAEVAEKLSVALKQLHEAKEKQKSKGHASSRGGGEKSCQ